MKLKSACALAAMVSFGSVFAATTWYVDDDWYEQGGDGSQESPFGTIQQAVNKASSGDTILVAPGVYTNGVSNHFRVEIPNTKTNLTIRATDGYEKTFIVGRRHSADSTFGDDAVGGVWDRTSKGKTILDGFTFRDCHRCQTTEYQGGTILGSSRSTCNVFNCRVTECSGGAVYSATVYNTLFIDNYPIPNGPDDRRTCTRGSAVVNCLFVRNAGRLIGFGGHFINCTIADSEASIEWEVSGFLNSISASVLTQGSYNVPLTNSVATYTLGHTKWENCHENVPVTNIFACVESFRDYRLRSGSPAVGLADPKLLTEWAPLPGAAFDPPDDPGRYSTYRDMAGNVIDLNAEHINAGAYQEVADIDDANVSLTIFKAQTGEMAVIGEGDDRTEFEGEAFIRRTSPIPMQWRLSSASPEEKPLSNIDDSLAGIFRVADKDGKIWVTSAPIGQIRRVSVFLAQKIFYMDPNGNDSWDGLSATWDGGTSGPWQTFTNAAVRLNAVGETDKTLLIRCAPGVYDKGESNYSRVPLIATGSSWKRYHFIGTAGAEKTFVVGADATTPDADEHGCGTNAVGCVFNGTVRCAGFTGFTFAGGRTSPEANSTHGAFAGLELTIPSGALPWIVLSDSIISNNTSSSAAMVGSNSGQNPFVLERCRIVGNHAPKGTIFYRAVLLGCVFADNEANTSGYAFRIDPMVAVNTTFVASEKNGRYFIGYTFPYRLYNSIFTDFNKGSFSSDVIAFKNVFGCVYDNSTPSSDPEVLAIITRTDSTTAKSRMNYVNKDGGDYRVLSCSPAVGAARMDGPEYVKYATTDFEGNPVCRGVAPTVSGAYTTPLTEGVDVIDPEGHLLADGEAGNGTHFLAEGEELTISANTAALAARPVVGITINGVTNLFTGAAGTIEIPFAAVEGTSLSVESVLGNTWYVNAGDDPGWAQGSDANCGWGTWAPLKTLTNAMAKAKSGDVVIAAPGRYDEGVVSCDENGVPYVLKRVKVPEGVTLRSEQGAEKTFIVGAPATIDPNEYGCGTNAVGCVNLQNRSKLEGFTLTGACGHGRTDKTGASAAHGVNPASIHATQISDCIISNCTAHFGIAMYGRYTRCRIVENRASGNILLYGTRLLNVHIDHNRFKESGDGYCYSQSAWTNVTWGAHNLTTEDKAPEWGVTPHAINAVNCIVFGKIKSNANDCTVSNCLITVGTFKNVDDPSKIMLDTEGRPLVVEGNLALDTGLAELYDAGAMGDKDASGRPRVMNAALDIGALEGDWRPRYSKDIGSRVTVTEATSGIVETDGRKVSFGAGGTVKFDWLCEPDQKCELSVNVTGDGVLVMTREGEEPVEYATKGTRVYAFKPAATGVQRFTLTYVPAEDDTGTAEILRAKRDIGLMLIVR